MMSGGAIDAYTDLAVSLNRLQGMRRGEDKFQPRAKGDEKASHLNPKSLKNPFRHGYW